jgi:hypothetical protein
LSDDDDDERNEEISLLKEGAANNVPETTLGIQKHYIQIARPAQMNIIYTVRSWTRVPMRDTSVNLLSLCFRRSNISNDQGTDDFFSFRTKAAPGANPSGKRRHQPPRRGHKVRKVNVGGDAGEDEEEEPATPRGPKEGRGRRRARWR